MILLHPSSIGKIMTDAVKIDPDLLTPELAVISRKTKKTDEDKALLEPLWEQTLSVGAKTYLKSLAKQIVYGVRFEVDTKHMRKGIACEQQAIDMLNSLLFKRYVKNTLRLETDLLSGEADILPPGENYGRDIKVSWSLETFPCVKEDAHDPLYEWQMRGYMHLYDRDEWHVAYLMLDTPEELCRYEPSEIHQVSHIPPTLRHTSITYKRDLELERKMLIKCRRAQEYIERIKAQIILEHEE